MWSPPQLGPVTTQLRAEFTAQLRTAQQALDVRVAARIFPDPARCADRIRGGVPDAGQWAQAREQARAGTADAADAAELQAQIAELTGSLRAGSRAEVIEVNADGVSISQTGLDRFGLPSLELSSISWLTLLPALSGDPDERHFQLAGGLGPLDRQEIRDALSTGLADVPVSNALIICRPAGWLVLEWAAATLAARPGARLLRVRAGTVDTAAWEILARLTVEAPLPEPYHLMLARVDDVTGAVRTQAQQLFARGAAPGTESRLMLRRPPGGAGELALAVFGADADPVYSEPLALYSTPPPAEQAFELRTVLDGPGRLRIVTPSGVQAHPGTWAQICGEIPRQVNVTARPVDLVCAVDPAGDVAAVRARLRLVRMLLELLTDEYPEPGRLRVGVVVCQDHDFERGHEERPVVRGIRPCPAADAFTWFAQQPAATARYKPAAPVEDLLHEAAVMLKGSRASGRAAQLLLVAGRPPHPSPLETSAVKRCPLRYRWQDSLRQLTSYGARCVAVADTSPVNDAYASVWEEIGADGLHWLPGATAQLVGEDLKLLTQSTQRIPLPLPDLE